MTGEELKERAEIYKQLIEYGPFQYLVKEMEQEIETMKEAIISDYTDDRLLDKGIIAGKQRAIYTPKFAVEESENSGPS